MAEHAPAGTAETFTEWLARKGVDKAGFLRRGRLFIEYAMEQPAAMTLSNADAAIPSSPTPLSATSEPFNCGATPITHESIAHSCSASPIGRFAVKEALRVGAEASPEARLGEFRTQAIELADAFDSFDHRTGGRADSELQAQCQAVRDLIRSLPDA